MGRPRDTGEKTDPPGFEQVFLPHLDAAYNLARWLLRDDRNAEDAVQEAYLRAYKAYGRFRGGDGKAWLMTIVRNVCFSDLRKTRGHETPEPFDEEIHQATGEPERKAALRKEASIESIHAALTRLPEEFREMIILHDLEGLTYKEMAAVAGIPIGTVMSRLARARVRLRAEILSADAKELS